MELQSTSVVMVHTKRLKMRRVKMRSNGKLGILRAVLCVYTINLLAIVSVSLAIGWKPSVTSIIKVLVFASGYLLMSPILTVGFISHIGFGIDFGCFIAIIAEIIGFFFIWLLSSTQSVLVRISCILYLLMKATVGLNYLYSTI